LDIAVSGEEPAVKRTIVAVAVLLVVVPIQAAESNKSTIAYLQKLQNKDGGFRPAADKDKSSLRATSSAIRALKYFGGDVPDRSGAANFVKSCYDKSSGGFADAPGGKPDVALTAVGLMALVELKIPLDDYETGAIRYLGENSKTFEDIRIAVAGLEAVHKKAPQNEAWLEQVNKMRNSNGFFGKGDGQARDTGGAIAAILRMGGKVAHADQVLKVLNEGQRTSGGFGKEGAEAELETSYRVTRAFHMLKTKPEGAAKLREFVGKCRNPDGGYGVMPGQPSGVGPTYFAGIILYWLK
jgi:prenyltransferase beta subunit